MKLKLYVFALFLFIGCNLFSQKNFQKGFIITNDNDTLYGEIDSRGDIFMAEMCTFKNNENQLFRYYPGDINSFRFIDGKYYVSRKVNDKLCFLEFIVKGNLSVYYLRDEFNERYFIENDNSELAELIYTESKIEKDGKKYLNRSKVHMGILNLYTAKAPELKSRIESIEKPNKSALVKLAEIYHDKTCNGDACIVYNNRTDKAKVWIKPMLGYSNSFLNPNYAEAKGMQFGILTNISLPKLNDNIFLKVGFIYSKPNTEHVQGHLIKLPVQAGYRYQGKFIKPFISTGMTYNNEFHFLPAWSAGIEFKTYKNIFLSVSYDADYDVVVSPDEIKIYKFSNSFVVGLTLPLLQKSDR